MSKKTSFLLAISAALLLILSFFTRRGAPLSFIALLPLLLAIDACNKKRRIYLSWISGGLFFNLLFYWIAAPVIDHGGIYRIPALLGMVIVSALLGIFFVLFSQLAHFFLYEVKRAPLFTIPALWTLVEMLRALLFPVLPLGLLGHTLARFPLLIQTADLFGIFGLSFIIAFVNTLLFLMITGRIKRREIALSLLFIALILSYGRSQLLLEEEDLLTIGMVQSNIAQQEKWDYSYRKRNIERHLLPTEEMALEVDMVIWPESAIPVDPNRDRAQWEALSQELKRIGAPVFTGLLSFQNTTLYNSSFLLLSGEIESYYHKLWLVPFGEYIPLQSYFPWINTGFHSISPGEEILLFRHQDLVWGSPICYEILNSSLMRKMAQDSDFLVNLSNEAWFKKTHGLHLLFSVLIIRAVELRRPMVKVANTGISGYVNSKGEVIESLPPHIHVYGAMDIKGGSKDSLYSRTGDLPLLILLLSLALITYGLYHFKETSYSTANKN